MDNPQTSRLPILVKRDTNSFPSASSPGSCLGKKMLRLHESISKQKPEADAIIFSCHFNGLALKKKKKASSVFVRGPYYFKLDLIMTLHDGRLRLVENQMLLRHLARVAFQVASQPSLLIQDFAFSHAQNNLWFFHSRVNKYLEFQL